MHEGKRLKELLHRHNKKQADLQRAANVATTTVWRWTKEEVLDGDQWQTIARALTAMKIDPSELKSAPVSGAREPEDLRPLIAGFNNRQLEALLKIMAAPPEEQFVLKTVIRDRLERQ